MTNPSNKLPKGVVLDRRRGVYRAKIYVEGQQTWLGSFATAEEASEAYRKAKASVLAAKTQARSSKPPPRRLGLEQRASIEADAAKWRGSYKGRPEPAQFPHPLIEGETLTDAFRVPRDNGLQLYRFVRKTWRFFGGRQWALWEWQSRCAHPECGETFTVTTPGALDRMGVPSAYCKAHRRPGRPAKAVGREEGGKAAQEPENSPGVDPEGEGTAAGAARVDLLGIGDLL